MRATVKVLDGGKVTIPATIREAKGLAEGDLAAIEVHGQAGNATVVG